MNLTINHPTLTADHQPRDGDTVVALSGDLDIASAPALRERLRTVLDGTVGGRLIIDLARVGFCDASGLAVLVGGFRLARERGLVTVLAAPQPQVMKVLHITGLDRVLAVQTAGTAHAMVTAA